MKKSLSWIAMRARDSMMRAIRLSLDTSRGERSKDSLTKKRGSGPEREGELVLSLKMKSTLRMMRSLAR
jgi:hypothetical protein